jgi:hypothetical protein
MAAAEVDSMGTVVEGAVLAVPVQEQLVERA